MKIQIVGDVHGTDFWKKAKEKVNDYDKTIFLGDYFDSFDIGFWKQYRNIREILDFKKEHFDAVDLLYGNHDFAYLSRLFFCSGTQFSYYEKISSLFAYNKECFQIASIYKNYVFSHAGISKFWLINNGIELKDINNIDYKKFGFVGPNNSGDNYDEGPLWIRPRSLLINSAKPEVNEIDNFNQVVGHTAMETELEMANGKKLFIVDNHEHSGYLELEI